MQVNLSIIGLDRISTSFALALKAYQEHSKGQHTFTIVGSDHSGAAMKTAQKLGALDNFDRKLLKAVQNANVVLVNTPVAQLADTYERLGPALKPGTVVLDMTEHNGTAINLGKQYFPKNEHGASLVYLVGVMPIVNAEGLYVADNTPEAASVDLFENAEVLIMPDPTCPGEAIALAEDLVKLIGGTARFMDPEEHDGLIAVTEGLPALVGTALFYTLQQSEGWSELRRMVNPSLALATHALRLHSPDDLQAALLANRANLLRNLDSFIAVLTQVSELLADENDKDGEGIEAFLSVVGKEWETWDIKRHSGKWDDLPKVETLPGPMGSMTGFLTMSRRKKNQSRDEDD